VIGELKDQRVEIWNGFEWSDVIIKQTGANQKLMRITLSNGAAIECTPQHKFYINNKSINGRYGSLLDVFKNPTFTSAVEAQNLSEGMRLPKHEFPTIEDGSSEFLHPYTHGFFCGDGNYRKGNEEYVCEKPTNDGEAYCPLHSSYKLASDAPSTHCRAIVNHHLVIELSHEKQELLPHLDYIGLWKHPNGKRTNIKVHPSIAPKFAVPINCNLDIKLKWLAGLADSDGNISVNGNAATLKISSIHPEFLEEVRLMLSVMGTHATVYLQKRGQQNVEICGRICNTQDLYTLVVATSGLCHLFSIGFNTHRLTWRPTTPVNREARKYVSVVSAEWLPEPSDTYCFTETKLHTAIFNGVITGQCTEIIEYTAPDEVAVCKYIRTAT
jgi:ribonucleoside-diphosphate reductase alpha chain